MEPTQKLYQALLSAKKNFKPIIKGAINPHYKSRYATLDGVLEAITPALHDAGLVLIQPLSVDTITTVLIHAESGEQLSFAVTIPQLQDPQKQGSVITYYRRYSVCAFLGVVAEEDDDGNATVQKTNTQKSATSSAPKSSFTKSASYSERPDNFDF